MNSECVILPLLEIVRRRIRLGTQPASYVRLFEGLTSVYCSAFNRLGQEANIVGMIREEYTKFGHRYLAAMKGSELIGFVSWRQDGRPDHGLVELSHIGTYRRTGVPHIGDRLIEAMIDDADRVLRERGGSGLRLVWLRTAEDGPAEHFYRRFGFRDLKATLPNHWHDGHDEAVYHLRVKEWREARVARI